MPSCQHVPPSPGQSLCACEHRRIELELLVTMLCQENAVLHRRLGTRDAPVVLNLEARR